MKRHAKGTSSKPVSVSKTNNRIEQKRIKTTSTPMAVQSRTGFIPVEKSK